MPPDRADSSNGALADAWLLALDAWRECDRRNREWQRWYGEQHGVTDGEREPVP